jgi:hypothetical protein
MFLIGLKLQLYNKPKYVPRLDNPNNPVVILRSRWPHPAIVPIEGAVLFAFTLSQQAGPYDVLA